MYLILVALAAFFYAVNQTVEHHFTTSVFKNLDPNFWNGQVSWEKAKKIFGSYPWDAFHISASFMIIIFCTATVLNQHNVWVWAIDKLKWYYQLLIEGVVWIFVFDIFFNHFLVSKDTSK